MDAAVTRVLSAGMMLFITDGFCAAAICAGVSPVLGGACELGEGAEAWLADAGLDVPVGPPGARTIPGAAA